MSSSGLTRTTPIGHGSRASRGIPWRPKGKRWPRGKRGIPLTFLGQICFADSKDILQCQLPGEVALIFGPSNCDFDQGAELEWSPLAIDNPEDGAGIPRTGKLPVEYQGVLHRTVQYIDWQAAEPIFRTIGYEQGGYGVCSIQATCIGSFADLPQGWPFKQGDGNVLIAVLSSYCFRGEWPLCDIPHALKKKYADGRELDLCFDNSRDFSISDAGCVWVYRDRKGRFKLDTSGH